MSIEELVKVHIETELAPDRKLDLQPDTSLVGIVDSSGVLELVIWMENTFGVAVELDQITAQDFQSIRSLSDLIRKNGGELKS